MLHPIILTSETQAGTIIETSPEIFGNGIPKPNRLKLKANAQQIFAMSDHLTRIGKPEEAIRVLKAITKDNNSDYRAEARVRIARLLLAGGNLKGAAEWYQALLDEKPNAVAARLELAEVLARLGNEISALEQVRRAEASGAPALTTSNIRRAIEYLRSQRGVQFDISIGLAPSTNINRATSSSTVNIFGQDFNLNKEGRAKSGLGVTYSANLVLRNRLPGGPQLTTQFYSTGLLYQARQFDDQTVAVTTGPELNALGLSFRPTVTVGERFYGARNLYDFFGAGGTVVVPQGPKAQFTFNASSIQLQYAANRASQTGQANTLGLAYDRSISSTLIVHIGASWNATGARYSGYRSTAANYDAAISKDFRSVTGFSRVVASKTWARPPIRFSPIRAMTSTLTSKQV